jgi:hypothetical protein
MKINKCGTFRRINARQYLNALHKERGCYVSAWEQDRFNRWMIRAYRIGLCKPDAPKPPPELPYSARKRRSERDAKVRLQQKEAMFALAGAAR